MDESKAFPVVDLKTIFAGPIEAVISANVMAAREFVKFIETYGFDHERDDPAHMLGELKMITFSFEQSGGPSGLPVKRLFRVPLLSMVPLPLLEVKEATFDFGVRIVGTTQPEKPQVVRLLRDAEAAAPPLPQTSWRGMLARGNIDQGVDSTPDLSPNLAANLQARVTVTQADIPAGIRNLLTVMGENAQLTPAMISVEPSRLDLPDPLLRGQDIDYGLVISTLLGNEMPAQPRTVIAYYDERLLTLKSSDSECWSSGSARQIDPSGRLQAWISLTVPIVGGLDDGPPPSRRTSSVLFQTERDGTRAVAELVCSLSVP